MSEYEGLFFDDSRKDSINARENGDIIVMGIRGLFCGSLRITSILFTRPKVLKRVCGNISWEGNETENEEELRGQY